MVLPIALGVASAVPATVGFLGNLFNSDRADARALARDAALGRGPGTLAAKGAVQDAQRQMIAQARGPSTNPLLAERNAMLAGADLQARAAPQIAAQQAAEMRQGRADLNAMGGQQGQILQQGLGALSSGLAGAAGLLGTSGGAPGAPQQPGAASPASPGMATPGIASGPPPSALSLGGQQQAPNLGGFASQLAAPAGQAVSPQAPAAGQGLLGGLANQLQLPAGMQSLDPALLLQLAGRF